VEFGSFVVLKTSAPSAGDTTPPAVALTAPANGQTVSGTVTLSAAASDNVGVAGVQFTIDGANLGAEDTSAPFGVSLDTRSLPNGTHALSAIARDAAGNRTTSSPVSVSVSNATSAVRITLEAEAGVLVSPMAQRTQTAASGGRYISTSTVNAGSLTFNVTVPQAGTYVIWGTCTTSPRTAGPTAGNGRR
jgi:hypothetical protein